MIPCWISCWRLPLAINNNLESWRAELLDQVKRRYSPSRAPGSPLGKSDSDYLSGMAVSPFPASDRLLTLLTYKIIL
ncbi:hypothetical protein KCP73_26520 [Salmonella enterica subsp. enterica]|nr:hypothetical protein KCP73_26520 [Salmonella enterica subsp. enterica]